MDTLGLLLAVTLTACCADDSAGRPASPTSISDAADWRPTSALPPTYRRVA
ncbi:MAG: hypothetical protein ACRCT8_11000 [Lacipirellulaceae bacterium]